MHLPLGKRHLTLGKQRLAFGKQRSVFGKQCSALGKQCSALRKQSSVLGNQCSACGKQHSSSGKQPSAIRKQRSVFIIPDRYIFIMSKNEWLYPNLDLYNNLCSTQLCYTENGKTMVMAFHAAQGYHWLCTVVEYVM